MSTRKPYYTPNLLHAQTIWKKPLPDFITEWLGWARRLAAKKLDGGNPLHKRWADELRDLKVFLAQVAAMPSTTEYASVGNTERSELASHAHEVLNAANATLSVYDRDSFKHLC